MAKDQNLLVNNPNNVEGQPCATRQRRSVHKTSDHAGTRALYHQVERAWNSAATDTASPSRERKVHSIRLPGGVVASLQFRRDTPNHSSRQVQTNQAMCGPNADHPLKLEDCSETKSSGSSSSGQGRGPSKPIKSGHNNQSWEQSSKQKLCREFFPSIKSEEPFQAFRMDTGPDGLEYESEMSERELKIEEDEDQRKVRFDMRPVAVDQVLNNLYFMVEALSQKGLKRILQCWIRECHPGKQGTHPYNGGNAAHSHDDYEEMNPGKHTAPPYWPNQLGWREKTPTACRHREPHHTRKWERQCLASHLLRLGSTYASEGFDFSLHKLEAATQGICEKNKNDFPCKAEAVLKDIYRAVRAYQSFERGERDGNSIIYVQMTDPNKVKRLSDDSTDDGSEKRRKRTAPVDPTELDSQSCQQLSAGSSFSSFSSDTTVDSNVLNHKDFREDVDTAQFYDNDHVVSSSSNMSVCSNTSSGLLDSYYPLAGHGGDVKPSLQELAAANPAPAADPWTARVFRSLPDASYHRTQAAQQKAYLDGGLQDDFGPPAKHPKLDLMTDSSVPSGPVDNKRNIAMWDTAIRPTAQYNSNKRGFVSADGNANSLQSINDFAGNHYLLDDPSWYPTQWDSTEGTRAINWTTSADGARSPMAPEYLSPYHQDNWQSPMSGSPNAATYAWPQAC